MSVGKNEGIPLGYGLDDGEPLGTPVGLPVGPRLGLALGTSDGATDGDCVTARMQSTREMACKVSTQIYYCLICDKAQ